MSAAGSPSADSSLLIIHVLFFNAPYMTLPDSSKNTPLYFPQSLSFLTKCSSENDHVQGLGDLATELS